jgi:hypothetical protein
MTARRSSNPFTEPRPGCRIPWGTDGGSARSGRVGPGAHLRSAAPAAHPRARGITSREPIPARPLPGRPPLHPGRSGADHVASAAEGRYKSLSVPGGQRVHRVQDRDARVGDVRALQSRPRVHRYRPCGPSGRRDRLVRLQRLRHPGDRGLPGRDLDPVPGVQQPERDPPRFRAHRLRQRVESRSRPSRLRSDGREAQRAELPRVDHGRAHGVMVPPDPARDVELR